jgi:hypothetical protein
VSASAHVAREIAGSAEEHRTVQIALAGVEVPFDNQRGDFAASLNLFPSRDQTLELGTSGVARRAIREVRFLLAGTRHWRAPGNLPPGVLAPPRIFPSLRRTLGTTIVRLELFGMRHDHLKAESLPGRQTE